jgi:hypothetical protein
MQSNDVADANEEEMARFLLEMYPGGGGGAKE